MLSELHCARQWSHASSHPSLQRWSLFPCSLNPYWPQDFLWCGELSRGIFVQVPTWGFYFGSEIAFPTAQPILLDLGSTNFICKEPNMLVGERKLKVESFETKNQFSGYFIPLRIALKVVEWCFDTDFCIVPKISQSIRLCPSIMFSDEQCFRILSPLPALLFTQREKTHWIHHLTENWDYAWIYAHKLIEST